MSQPGEEKIVKSSAVLISSGKRLRLYRSVDEVPGRLRKRIIDSTSGINSGTILIANRAGRERMLRALRSLPRGARKQVFSAFRGESEAPSLTSRRRRRLAALVVSLGTAVALWCLAAWWRT